MSVPRLELGRVCPRQLRKTTLQYRSFSSTTKRRRNGPIAVFPETSSPELNTLLNTLRENVFLPAHLSTAQKHLVYRQHFQPLITGEEPVKVKLPTTKLGLASDTNGEKEEFVLKPLSKTKDEPNLTASWNKILDLIVDHQDGWVVIPNVLRELHISNFKLKAHQVEKLCRRAASAGKTGLMIELLRRWQLTEVKIRSPAIAKKLIEGATQAAAQANFGETELNRAIGHVNFVLANIPDPSHVPVHLEGMEDPKNHPDIYGAAFGLLAVRRWLWETQNTEEARAARATTTLAEESAVPETEGEGDGEGKVTTQDASEQADTSSSEVYVLGATDLKKIEENALRMLELSENADLDIQDSRRAAVVLQNWLPTWLGIQVASRIEKFTPEIMARLQGAFGEDIDPAVQKAVKIIEELDEATAPTLATLQTYKTMSQFLSSA